jgi:hypothetical protein
MDAALSTPLSQNALPPTRFRRSAFTALKNARLVRQPLGRSFVPAVGRRGGDLVRGSGVEPLEIDLKFWSLYESGRQHSRRTLTSGADVQPGVVRRENRRETTADSGRSRRFGPTGRAVLRNEH